MESSRPSFRFARLAFRLFITGLAGLVVAGSVGLAAQATPGGQDPLASPAAPAAQADKAVVDAAKSANSGDPEDPLKRKLSDAQRRKNAKKTRDELSSGYRKWLGRLIERHGPLFLSRRTRPAPLGVV